MTRRHAATSGGKSNLKRGAIRLARMGGNQGDVKEGRGPIVAMVVDRKGVLNYLFHSCSMKVGSALPVILIQAESRDDGKVLVGYRPLNGGNGICLLSSFWTCSADPREGA